MVDTFILFSFNINYNKLNLLLEATSLQNICFAVKLAFLHFKFETWWSCKPLQASFQLLTIVNEKPEKDGYVFVGWATDFGDGVVIYNGGDGIECSQDLYLYAVWEKAEDYFTRQIRQFIDKFQQIYMDDEEKFKKTAKFIDSDQEKTFLYQVTLCMLQDGKTR